jgi:integrase
VSRLHRESPLKRTNPSGEVVWYARYTDSRGNRRSAGTYKRRREAQDAIDNAYGLPRAPETVGSYFESWTARHPRSKRTNDTNEHRITRVLDVQLEGRALCDWPLSELRRRHAHELVEHMLEVQGRASLGALGILRSLSAMAEDAINDELAEVNPFRGLRIRANDPRARRTPRAVRVFTFEQMHAFAAAAGPSWEPMVRTFADTGMRLGEVLPLERADLVDGVFHVRRTSHEGRVLQGTKTDHGEPSPGRDVPCPPGLAALIKGMARRIDTRLLFPTPRGRLWRQRNFYRDVWKPTQEAAGLDIRPHEMRHSFITHLRAAGVDDADLAAMAGHRVETMLSVYTHALGRSFERVCEVIG